MFDFYFARWHVTNEIQGEGTGACTGTIEYVDETVWMHESVFFFLHSIFFKNQAQRVGFAVSSGGESFVLGDSVSFILRPSADSSKLEVH